jgi:L-malate glycosyltransferase
MRIGITCYPTYGGSGVVATELGLELAQRGHQVHFISYSQPIRLTEPQPNIHYHEVEVSRYPLFEYPPYDLALATRMAEVAEIYDLDLLHVHYAIPHSVSAMLARQMLGCDHARNRRHLPYVTTLHGTDITLVGADPSYLPITRFSIDQSDGVTSISNYLKQRTLEVFDVRTPIEVIPNFVNCDLYERTPEVMQRRSEYARAGREDSGSPVQLPPGKTYSRRHRDLRSRAEEGPIAAAHDRRRTGTLARRVAGRQQRYSQQGGIPRQAGPDSRKAGSR